MSSYLYLFRGGQRQESSPEEMQAIMQKWMKWMEDLGKQGKLNGGERLGFTGKVVNSKTNVATDGPFAEGKEIVGGYLVIKAADIDEATVISRGCPIFEVGGTVEIRPIEVM